MTLSNMGRDYSDLGETDKALAIDCQSLAIWREVQDRRGEAFALSIMGRAYSDLGQPENALASELAALSLAKVAGDPDIEGGIETSLMIGFRAQHRPEEAIFFGMAAVNSFQQIRRNMSGLDKGCRWDSRNRGRWHIESWQNCWSQADRLGEAEQVLDLLKEQELKEVVRGAAPALRRPRLSR